MKYLDQKTRPRNWCLAMITNPYPFISPNYTSIYLFFFWGKNKINLFYLINLIISMLVILLNCVTLGMYQPCEEGNCDTTRCKILQVRSKTKFFFRYVTHPMTSHT
ncbi:hypothetical protein Phum_PHUM255550 [Pediculus humanus corporis]|uniref:Uncharacterized protein n=1 Tax=Pediculus humanus subsp. corporis TaxID=121224 RepID=E0VK30_PEDHC|nr:uncharacterized protein Phum_PHUM255550 [Pediculus humanus corporis]EEB13736.1 hypothetical protein Phum_PHUM255550 [Pediculus humanus corporis]